MQFIKPDINIDFIGKRKVAFYISAALILICIFTLIMKKGPKYGVDFAGGTLIQVKFSSDVNIDSIKSGLVSIDLLKTSVQQFGEDRENEYLIRTNKPIETKKSFSEKMEEALHVSTGVSAELRRIEMVGPQVGEDLRKKALMAMFFALLFITTYISGRFERFELKWVISGVMATVLMGAVYLLSMLGITVSYLIPAAVIVAIVLCWVLQLKYAMGAIVALIHDVTITVGIFSVCDKEFTLPIIAALLTIIGYSLNDTIIVFDRIRENLKKNYKSSLEKNINKSINETLSRTILTSLTTLAVVITLLVYGGGIIHDFAFALAIGVLIGTYSSIYVASPILIAWQNREKMGA